jgi:hypothetical protein
MMFDRIIGNKAQIEAVRRLDPHRAIAAIGPGAYENLYAKMWRAIQPQEGPWKSSAVGVSPKYAAELALVYERMPDGWVSTDDLRAAMGLEKERIGNKLASMFVRGMVERRNIRRPDGTPTRFIEWRKVPYDD